MRPPEQQNDAEAVRRARVRQLFEAQPFAEPTENVVLVFYQWLEKRYRHLLPTEIGDLYQLLKADLNGLYKYDPPEIPLMTIGHWYRFTPLNEGERPVAKEKIGGNSGHSHIRRRMRLPHSPHFDLTELS